MIFRNRMIKLIMAAVLTVSLSVTPVFALGGNQTGEQTVGTSSGEQTVGTSSGEQTGGTSSGDQTGGTSSGEQTGETSTDNQNGEQADNEAETTTESTTVIQDQPVEAMSYMPVSGTWKFWQRYSGKSAIITCSGGKLRGIDISVWQGNVDWAKIAVYHKEGYLDFVIIRCAHGTKYLDKKFKENVEACEKYGIPYGVYLYTTATSTSGARKEAAIAMNLLSGHYPDLPVYFDMEAKSILKKTKSKSRITDFARTFCSTLDNNGYRAGVYASLSWFNRYIDGSSLKKSGYDLWLAQWPASSKSYSSLGHGSKYNVWQVCSYGNYVPSGKSSSGIDWVSGISGRVDLNLMMKSMSEMKDFMNYDDLPATLEITTPPFIEAYVLTSTTGRKGPGPGYKTDKTYAEGTVLSVNGTANGYIRIADADDSWIASGSVVDVNSPKGFDNGVLKSYAGDTITSQWATVKGSVYYVNEEGAALTGFQTIDGKDYYLGSDGAAKSNKLVTVEGTTYYLGKNGLITKNAFVSAGLYRYGFDENGAMMKNCSPWIGCRSYTIDGNGHAYILKAKTIKKAGYYSGRGSGRKGTLKKNRSFYVVATSGKWSRMADGYWIRTSYTKKTAVYPTIKPSADADYSARLTKKTRSYTGPSASYIKKTYYKKNRKVTVTGTYGSWAKISSGNWLPLNSLKKY